MMTFWLIAAVMVVGCLAWLLPTVLSPLRDTEDASPTHDDHARASYAERLDAVEKEHADGALSDAQLEEARRELARELLQDTRSQASPKGLGVTAGAWLGSAVVILAVPLLAIITYLQLGSLDSLGIQTAGASQPAATAAPAEGGANPEMPSIEQMVSSLAERLQNNPDDAQGWLMLGRSYLVLNRPQDAEAAYAKAYAIDAGRADVLTGYAEAIARNNNNSLAGRSRELLQSALAIAPQDPKTLWLSGIAAMQGGDGDTAIRHWEALKNTQALNAEESVSLDRMIAEARGEAPGPVLGPVAPVAPVAGNAQANADKTNSKASAGVAVSVTVSLAPDLADKVQTGDTLFVFARAEQGPPMPLAVVRMPAPTFPVTVQLDESMAMMPQMTLATFPRVVIGARISKSGNAQASPGDLQGLSSALAPASTDRTAVEIAEIVGQ